ncbi:hypothetical protein METH_06575 [Leisingera methylohalidivorans DSM 14336]|uniref:Uncharacterized protein n=1 Tax=Leisingera methylohalidivorans DSM 14336 TaxID=999552 RepID=V9VZX4_9RHOB|nr:hypothetical protein METH_06575 [Leisingera methylohalidivorans DSM 14336]
MRRPGSCGGVPASAEGGELLRGVLFPVTRTESAARLPEAEVPGREACHLI